MPISRAFVRIEVSWLRICAINEINCETLCYEKLHMGFPFVMRGPKSLRGQRLKSKVQRMEIYMIALRVCCQQNFQFPSSAWCLIVLQSGKTSPVCSFIYHTMHDLTARKGENLKYSSVSNYLMCHRFSDKIITPTLTLKTIYDKEENLFEKHPI